MNISTSYTAARPKNWFTERRVENGAYQPSYASQTADIVSLTGSTTAVATGASLLGQLARGSVLGTIAATAVGVVTGAVAGAVASPVIDVAVNSVFKTNHSDDGGEIAGGAVLGALAGGIGALSGALGAGPGSVALWSLGASGTAMGLVVGADHFGKS